MIETLRAGQIVEFERDPHDGTFRRFMVLDVDDRRGSVALRFDPPEESLPLAVVKTHMVVIREPSPVATAPTGPTTKDDVFNSVFEFIDHERECAECAGELEGGDLSERWRYLCAEARRMLSWFQEHEGQST